MLKYLRNVIILIEEGVEDANLNFTVKSRKEVQGLKVVFNIKNTRLGDASKGYIQIYNINSETAALLTGRNAQITISVSYGDVKPYALFRGQVTNSYSIRQGADKIQHVWVRDSWNSLENYYPVAQSFSGDLYRGDLLETLVGTATQLGGYKFLGDAEEVLKNSIRLKTWTFSGTLKEELDDLLSPLQLSWQVAFGELRISNNNEVISTNTSSGVYKVSQNTGLLTVPERDWVGVSFAHLLDTNLQPDQIIYLDPNTVKYNLGNEYYVQPDYEKWTAQGTFKIMEVVHKGDTRGSVWDSEVKAYGNN